MVYMNIKDGWAGWGGRGRESGEREELNFFSYLTFSLFVISFDRLEQTKQTMNTRRSSTKRRRSPRHRATVEKTFNIKSKQPLRGGPESKTAKKISQKTQRVEKKAAATESKIETAEQRIVKATEKLDGVLGRIEKMKQELMERGETIPEGKDEKGAAVIPPHPAAVGMMNALDMPLEGRRQDRVGKPDQKKLPHTHKAAPPMAKKTKSDLYEGDIQMMDYRAQYYGTDLQFGGYKHAGKTTTNDRGKEVDENYHIVGKEKYEHWEETGTGLALRNATLSNNLIERIPNMATRYPSMSRCRKGSFDILQLPEDYNG